MEIHNSNSFESRLSCQKKWLWFWNEKRSWIFVFLHLIGFKNGKKVFRYLSFSSRCEPCPENLVSDDGASKCTSCNEKTEYARTFCNPTWRDLAIHVLTTCLRALPIVKSLTVWFHKFQLTFRNFFSARRSSQCLKRPACNESDYIETSTACDKDNMVYHRCYYYS